MIFEDWHKTPAVIFITEDDCIIFFRAESAILGFKAKEIIVITNHPALYSRYADEWLRSVVRPKLIPGGIYREVTKEY